MGGWNHTVLFAPVRDKLKMLKVGLTGGFGSGKTTVAALFSAKGIPVLDADAIARELVEQGRPALAEIVAAFGDRVLLEGRLNRAFLRDLIYADATARRRLEEIMHPKVYQALCEQEGRSQGPYCVFAIPLLIETGKQAFVDRILLVDCPVELQYERARKRDGLEDSTIGRIIAAQASRAQRLAAAHDIIDNSGSSDRLRDQVEKLHQAYLAQARHHA